MLYYLRDRGGERSAGHLAAYAGILQADAYGGYGKLYEAGRPGVILIAGFWARTPQMLFVGRPGIGGTTQSTVEKPSGVVAACLEEVQRIDQLRDGLLGRLKLPARSAGSRPAWTKSTI